MSDYIVSARKYRPQTFDTVVGQEHITTTLKNAIRHNHLAHAYLFCGPRGVGKTTCARILARTINCENPTPDTEACGVCATCKSFQNNTSFNIFELDAASNNSVDDIRELVNQVRFAPQQGRYKIYIIDEVHMLSAAAFNAFLKTLEEPPPYAIFILATTEKHKILPTILSRCQIFDFKRITTGDTVAHLQSIAAKEGLMAEEAALHVIAQKSEGCMRDSLSMLDRIASFTNGSLTYAGTMEHLNLLDADFYFRLTDGLLSQDISSVLLHLNAVLEKGFEGDAVINGLAEHFRNLLLCKDARMAKLLDVPQDHKAIYFEKANQMPPAYVLSALNVVNDAELGYKNATNKRLHVELCLIRLCYLVQAVDADSVSKKNFDGGLSAATSAPVSSFQPATPAVSPTATTSTPVSQPVPQPSAPISHVAAPPVSYGAPPPKPAPAPIQQEAPKPTPVPASPASSNSAPANSPARRVSLNILDDLDNLAAHEQVAQKELTAEIVLEIFNDYKNTLREESQSVLLAQFTGMSMEVKAADEVCIICPNEMGEEYAKNQRDYLIDLFRKATGGMVRITTEVRHDPNAEPEVKVLSKQETYDELVRKNPNLASLKEGLNLQIEF